MRFCVIQENKFVALQPIIYTTWLMIYQRLGSHVSFSTKFKIRGVIDKNLGPVHGCQILGSMLITQLRYLNRLA